MLSTFAMALSVIGAIFNSIGIERKNDRVTLTGQRIWVLSNALWVYILYTDINQLITYATFLVCAAYPVTKDIIRRYKYGKCKSSK